MPRQSVFDMKVSKVYPLLVAKAEKKGRTKAEVDEVTAWLTGYDMETTDLDVTYAEFFDNAPAYNPRAELIDTLNGMAGREVFGLCLDSGHLNLIRRDPRRYVAVLGRRIKATHLHDNNGFTDEHIVPFSGTMNWKHLCQALHDAGYSGDLSFETFLQTEHVLRFDEELLLPWLKLIHTCGEAFAKTVSP